MKLLKAITTSLFLLLTSGILMAGDNNPKAAPVKKLKVPLYKQLEWGAKIGFNESSNGYTNLEAAKFFSNPEFGPVFGFTVALPYGKYLGARMELLYSQNVFIGEGNLVVPFTYINKRDYLDIPLVIQIKPIKNLDLFVGGDYAILVGSTYKYDDSPLTLSQEQQFENSSSRHNVIGFVFGADYKLFWLTLGARITCGVPDNNSQNPQNTFIAQFTIGYTFHKEFIR